VYKTDVPVVTYAVDEASLKTKKHTDVVISDRLLHAEVRTDPQNESVPPRTRVVLCCVIRTAASRSVDDYYYVLVAKENIHREVSVRSVCDLMLFSI
jgi:hypothetical protein